MILYDDRQVRDLKAFCFDHERSSVLPFDKTSNLGAIYVTASVHKNMAVQRKSIGDHPLSLVPFSYMATQSQ